MKVIGFNGRTYELDIKKYVVDDMDDRPRSQYHLKARSLLHDIVKGYEILEEVKLPGSRNPALKSVLFLDFFIPRLSLAVEVHGQQHYEYSKFFHKTRAGFVESQNRDRLKAEWCENNNIQLVILKYSDDIDIWREQIEYF